MTSVGYMTITQRREAITATLRDAAVLIGEPGTQPVTLQNGSIVVPGLGLKSDATTLTRRVKDLQEGIFKVLVYGEFKHGKSTLLNAMLGTRLLPAKTLKCTAIISMLVHGDRTDVAIYETGNEQPTLMSREEFMQRFQLTAEDEETLHDKGFVDRFKHIEYAHVECLSPLCANGVRLVDSPGLGDHPSRTRVTTRYLRESHAIIMMLNAMRLLSDDEKHFIQTQFKPGHLHNVFFVVNRINQINQREVGEVKSYFRAFLEPYFVAENGSFDEELYARRVFFINALGALESRSSTPTDEGALEVSGVLALERELEHFLTSDQRNTTALEEATRFLENVVTEALKTIEQQKALQDLPLGDFEQAISEAEHQLQKLERKRQDIDRTIQLFGETIAQKVLAGLRAYLDEMHETWAHEAYNLKLDEVSFGTVMASVLEGFIDKEQARKRIEEPIKREVEKYIEEKIHIWTEKRTSSLIQADMDMMVREVEEQLVEFKLGLDRIGRIVVPAFTPYSAQEREESSEWAQMLIKTILHDIGGVESALVDWDDWGDLFWRIVQQILILYVATLFSGPVGWTIFAVAQVVQLFWAEQQFKQRLLTKIGDELHKNLMKELPAMQSKIYQDIKVQFGRLAQSITRALQEQMEEKRQELTRILVQKRDASFSAEQEKQRLDTIGERLIELREGVRGKPA